MVLSFFSDSWNAFIIEMFGKVFHLNQDTGELLLFGMGLILLMSWLNILFYGLLFEPEVFKDWKSSVFIGFAAILGFSSFVVVSLLLFLVFKLMPVVFGSNTSPLTNNSLILSFLVTEFYMLGRLFIKKPFGIFRPLKMFVLKVAGFIFKIFYNFPFAALSLFIKKPVNVDSDKLAVPKKIRTDILFNIKASVFLIITGYFLLIFPAVRGSISDLFGPVFLFFYGLSVIILFLFGSFIDSDKS